eukprot:6781834-Heterocapsa_arctica.AAC.1
MVAEAKTKTEEYSKAVEEKRAATKVEKAEEERDATKAEKADTRVKENQQYAENAHETNKAEKDAEKGWDWT